VSEASFAVMWSAHKTEAEANSYVAKKELETLFKQKVDIREVRHSWAWDSVNYVSEIDQWILCRAWLVRRSAILMQ
jgi:hypothetical protein